MPYTLLSCSSVVRCECNEANVLVIDHAPTVFRGKKVLDCCRGAFWEAKKFPQKPLKAQKITIFVPKIPINASKIIQHPLIHTQKVISFSFVTHWNANRYVEIQQVAFKFMKYGFLCKEWQTLRNSHALHVLVWVSSSSALLVCKSHISNPYLGYYTQQCEYVEICIKPSTIFTLVRFFFRGKMMYYEENNNNNNTHHYITQKCHVYIARLASAPNIKVCTWKKMDSVVSQ